MFDPRDYFPQTSGQDCMGCTLDPTKVVLYYLFLLVENSEGMCETREEGLKSGRLYNVESDMVLACYL